MKTSSWIICDKETGKAIFETNNEKTANSINTKKYIAYGAHEYLVKLNQAIKTSVLR